jgi:hypothetical protein
MKPFLLHKRLVNLSRNLPISVEHRKRINKVIVGDVGITTALTYNIYEFVELQVLLSVWKQA